MLRGSSTFRLAVILLVGGLMGMVGVLAVVGGAIDAHQRFKEQSLVERRLQRARGRMGEEIMAASIWDEAVEHMSGAGDDVWFNRELLPFLATYSSHVATVGYNEAGALFGVGLKGAPAATAPTDPFARAAHPLAVRLRAASARRDRLTSAKQAVRLTSAYVQVGDAVYLAGGSTIVRHTPEGPVPAADPVVVSFRPLSSVVGTLNDQLGLTDPTFAVGAPPGPEKASVAVLDDAGGILGHIVWTPERPGARILREAGPMLLIVLGVMGAVGLVLLRRSAQDLRRLRASEGALSAALHKAQAANRAKSRFLSNISHELRTPLNGVLGIAEVMSAEPLTPQQRQRIELLKASGQAQLQMIEKLLDIVRLRDDAVTLDIKPFRPEVLLKRLALEHRPAARARGLILTVQADKGDWRGDEIHIEKLLAPLVDNAMRFTQSGAVTLSAQGRPDGLMFEVCDTGPGMDAAAAARLLDALAQDDDSATRVADGAGLGLTVANGLTQLMGGRLEVISRPSEGTRVRVTLPLAAIRSSAGAAV